MVTQEAGVETRVTPEAILTIAGGFMAAKHLFIAADLGLFAQLAHGPLALEELTARVDVARPVVRMSADAMVALGLLEKADGLYRNGPAAQVFLSGATPADLRPLLRFWDRISYPAWIEMEATLRSGNPHSSQLDEEKSRIFAEGVEAITAPAAHALAAAYDFSGHRRVLDVGGGTGSFLRVLVDTYPRLTGTVFELPSTAVVARQCLARTPQADRIDVVEGDIFRDPVPEGHDAVLMANFLHLFGEERVRASLRRVRAAVPEGTALLLADFWTDASHTQPVFAALMAGEFRAITGEGDVYSVEEMRDWLADAGWLFTDHRPLAGPAGLIVAQAI